MIQTYSSTIRRREMEAVLTCMVDEKIGPGEMTLRLVQTAKELMGCDGAVAVRSPAIALEYVLKAINLDKESAVMISALAPYWLYVTLEKLGYKVMILDVQEDTSLVSVETVEEAVKNGGRLLILSETMGILPDIRQYLALEIPVIEEISHSALSYYPADYEEDSDKPAASADSGTSAGAGQESAEASKEEPSGLRAGMYGLYAILGMEEHDIVTAGGGALVIAPKRREWSPLKAIADQAPSTDFMPDMNAALAFVELKEFARNEKVRKELFTLFSRAVMSGRHKTFVRGQENNSTIYSFPLVLNSGFKDVKLYAQKKGIEVRQAFENSVIAFKQEELSIQCICANSLLLRCALFPLYPRLGQKDASRIVKVLSSLP